MNPQALDALRDIHLPAPPAWWAIPEVWVAAALVAAAFAWHARRAARTRLLRRALREVSALTAAHGRDGDTAKLARGLSQLLRRHAAACFPDAGIEGLAGKAWLDFLDAHGGGGAFTHGAGAVLDTLPYQASGETDAAALTGAVRRWLQENPR